MILSFVSLADRQPVKKIVPKRKRSPTAYTAFAVIDFTFLIFFFTEVQQQFKERERNRGREKENKFES